MDKFDNKLGEYGDYDGTNYQDFWTDWYTGDTLKVKLVTDSSRTDYGFKIDKTEIRPDKSISNNSLAESDHPYANNFVDTWTVSEPDASQIRLHFEYIQLASDDAATIGGYDKVILLDKFDNKLKTYGDYDGINYQDFWTDWYTGDTLKVKLVTDGSRTDYGFKIDRVKTRVSEINNFSESVDTKDSNTAESTEVQYGDTDAGGNKILTTTKLTSSANFSAFGQSVILVAKVDTPSQGTEEPFGTVTFIDGTKSIGVVDVSSGQATLETPSLSSGSHSITARYSGDINFKPSTSSPFTLTVKEQTNTGMAKSSSKDQFSSEQLNSSEEKSSTEQNSAVKKIIVIISENPLVSGLILLVISIILQKKYFPPPKSK
ncbi:hypothetical protein MSBR3_2470 [Methanosarcina barkeri 3]|uniref:CUB domain-containing protein n=1 Tax=Methanosarcina barkeri 3 TaxID=1434107 RepID=A0A0E3SNU8_METBA|nr:hypothetical protein MSBR3_2470 [Methanosarcina barkeri 3]